MFIKSGAVSGRSAGHGENSGGVGDPAPNALDPGEIRDLQRGAELVRKVYDYSLPGMGHGLCQRPHMGDDDVLFFLAHFRQGPGVFDRGQRVIKALIPGVGGGVMPVIQEQIMKQPHAGRHSVITVKTAREAKSDIGDKQGMVVCGRGKMMPPLLHGAYLLGRQKIFHAGQVRILIDEIS